MGAVDGTAQRRSGTARSGGTRCNARLLLCDRLWAGSDTWATSNALAVAICRLGGVDPVLCGISALDGETGALAHHMRELPIRSEDPLEARNRIR